MRQANEDPAIALELIHRHALGIIKSFIEICERHSLRYIAVAGTALGAVRHQGFIPWDDDVDFGMPRDDYEQFLAIAPKELPENLSLHFFPRNADYMAYFSKVCDKNTVYIDQDTKRLKDYPHHIWIDIFPIDKISCDKKTQRNHLRKNAFLYELFKCKTTWTVSSLSSGTKKLFGSIFRPALRILTFWISKQKAYELLTKQLQKFDNEKTDYCLVFATGGEKNIFRMEELFPGKKVRFENLIIPIPNNYDKVLQQAYGNYWALPPENQRYGHKAIEVREVK